MNRWSDLLAFLAVAAILAYFVFMPAERLSSRAVVTLREMFDRPYRP